MKWYAISGLGADERVFHYLELDHEIVPVRWLKPEPEESLSAYCQRLAQGIDTSEAFGLLGVSFGGMVACELNKYLSPQRTVIVSSAALGKHIPSMYRFMGRLRLDRWLPDAMLIPPPFALSRIMGAESVTDRKLLQAVCKDTDLPFTRWAIRQITQWNNTALPANLCWIHGDKDKVLPYFPAEANIVPDGTHFMIVNKAAEISRIINGMG